MGDLDGILGLLVVDNFKQFAHNVGVFLLMVCGSLLAAFIFNKVLLTLFILPLQRLLKTVKSPLWFAIGESKILQYANYLFYPLALLLGNNVRHLLKLKLPDIYENISIESANLFTFFILSLVAVSVINGVNAFYEHKRKESDHYPIYGYIKMAKVIVWLVSFLWYVSFLLNRSPMATLTGLGAASAVLVLIFKDTILGLVSSIQATANKIVKIGDWITVPEYMVDGMVVDISITRVKVLNFDNSTVNIPTTALTSQMVQNLQSMVNSNARRVMRSFFIDSNTIKILSEEQAHILMAKHKFIAELGSVAEVMSHSNLTLYRWFFTDYLKNNPLINQDFPHLVRYMGITPFGVEVQLYTHARGVYLTEFEEIQSSVFEFLLVTISDFELKVTQASSESTKLERKNALFMG